MIGSIDPAIDPTNDIDQSETWQISATFLYHLRLRKLKEVPGDDIHIPCVFDETQAKGMPGGQLGYLQCQLMIMRMEVKVNGDLTIWAAEQGLVEGSPTLSWIKGEHNEILQAQDGHKTHELTAIAKVKDGAQWVLDMYNVKNKLTGASGYVWRNYHETGEI